MNRAQRRLHARNLVKLISQPNPYHWRASENNQNHRQQQYQRQHYRQQDKLQQNYFQHQVLLPTSPIPPISQKILQTLPPLPKEQQQSIIDPQISLTPDQPVSQASQASQIIVQPPLTNQLIHLHPQIEIELPKSKSTPLTNKQTNRKQSIALSLSQLPSPTPTLTTTKSSSTIKKSNSVLKIVTIPEKIIQTISKKSSISISPIKPSPSPTAITTTTPTTTQTKTPTTTQSTTPTTTQSTTPTTTQTTTSTTTPTTTTTKTPVSTPTTSSLANKKQKASPKAKSQERKTPAKITKNKPKSAKEMKIIHLDNLSEAIKSANYNIDLLKKIFK